jgi:3-methyladenine DNA glycosylase AlkD
MTTQTSLSRVLPDYFEVKLGSSIFELETETLLTSMTHQYLSRNTAIEETDNYDIIFGITKSEIKSFLFEKAKNDEVFIDLFGTWVEEFKTFHEKRNEPLSRDVEFGFSDGSRWIIKILDLIAIRTTPDSDFAINFDDDLLKNDEEFLSWVNDLNWDDIKHLADEIKRPQPEPDYESEWKSAEKSIVKWEDSFSIFDFFEISDTMSEEDSDDDRSI